MSTQGPRPESASQPAGTFAGSVEMRNALREPFPREQIGKLPRAGTEVDYVGHAAVTDRLNKAAPGWTYTLDTPFSQGDRIWIRGVMTIGGISRPEYGDGKTPKEAVGNFIRRGAMRFGVALDLWSKEELEDVGEETRAMGKGSGPSSSTGSGEGGAPLGSGSPPRYPKTPEQCSSSDHRDNRGRRTFYSDTSGGLVVRRCALCGMSEVSAVEGTSVDLGPAVASPPDEGEGSG